MTKYRVDWRESTGEWVIYSGGTPIRTYQSKRPAHRKARQFARKGDELVVKNKDGTISRHYMEPIG